MSYFDRWYIDKATQISRLPSQGTDKVQLLGQSLTVNAENIPLLTVKRTPWRLAIKEMLWFVSPSYNYTDLTSAGVHWWQPWVDDWQTKQYKAHELKVDSQLVAAHLPYKRHYKAFGRISARLQLGDYDSTRLFCSLWPSDDELPQVILPPCALSYQLLHCDGVLSIEVYQRSADLMCGVPTNVCQYAFLLQLYAGLAGLQPGTVRFTYGSLHVYESHMAQPEFAQLLQRTASSEQPKVFGIAKVVSSVRTNRSADVADAEYLSADYSPQSLLRFDVAKVHTVKYIT